MPQNFENLELGELSIQELVALASQEFELFKVSIHQKDLVAGTKVLKSLEKILGAAVNELDLGPYFSQGSVEVQYNSFCFTGDFVYGDRQQCEKVIIDRDGRTLAKVSAKLNYLVVGHYNQGNWTHKTFANKIKMALEIIERQKNSTDFDKLQMITEEHWLEKVLQINPVEFRQMYEDRLSESVYCRFS
jgi:NAD-dependent DNA ligase